VLEAPGRVELPTYGLGNRRSIHLSYGAIALTALLAAAVPRPVRQHTADHHARPVGVVALRSAQNSMVAIPF
jgi:hypothetical protein